MELVPFDVVSSPYHVAEPDGLFVRSGQANVQGAPIWRTGFCLPARALGISGDRRFGIAEYSTVDPVMQTLTIYCCRGPFRPVSLGCVRSVGRSSASVPN